MSVLIVLGEMLFWSLDYLLYFLYCVRFTVFLQFSLHFIVSLIAFRLYTVSGVVFKQTWVWVSLSLSYVSKNRSQVAQLDIRTCHDTNGRVKVNGRNTVRDFNVNTV